MNSNERIFLKEQLVKAHWEEFPITASRVPPKILEKLVRLELYKPRTSPEAIVNALNNLYFRIMKKTNQSRASKLGQAFLDKSECHLTKSLAISICCRGGRI